MPLESKRKKHTHVDKEDINDAIKIVFTHIDLVKIFIKLFFDYFVLKKNIFSTISPKKIVYFVQFPVENLLRKERK